MLATTLAIITFTHSCHNSAHTYHFNSIFQIFLLEWQSRMEKLGQADLRKKEEKHLQIVEEELNAGKGM